MASSTPEGLRAAAVLAEVRAAAADAVHFLREVHGLEPHGEGTHQVAGELRRPVANGGGELETRLLVPVAAADGGLAVELHQLEELQAALLEQNFPDQRAERVHVLAQGLVLRGKVDVVADHVSGRMVAGRGLAAPGSLPCQQHGLGALELLRLPVEDYDIAIAQAPCRRPARVPISPGGGCR